MQVELLSHVYLGVDVHELLMTAMMSEKCFKSGTFRAIS